MFGKPRTTIGKVQALEGIMTASATGEAADNDDYMELRRDLLADPQARELLPKMVKNCRTLAVFWPYIKNEAGTYAERRSIIGTAFTPLMDHLERAGAPGDDTVSATLQSFDAGGVHVVWMKALARRDTDPEGAITVARTLLETVCKRILDESQVAYTDKEDLPKLYSLAAKALNLSPDQHADEPIKAILGGAMNLVNGIGTLRNRFSDAHGRGGKLPVRPSARHASLAVNTAGAVATFLVETHLARNAS